jgi:hypothetical protein
LTNETDRRSRNLTPLVVHLAVYLLKYPDWHIGLVTLRQINIIAQRAFNTGDVGVVIS